MRTPPPFSEKESNFHLMKILSWIFIVVQLCDSLRFNSFKMSNIEVYSSIGCKYCRIAKMKLKSLCVPFDDVNIHVEDSAFVSSVSLERAKLARSSTVPQIYIGEEHIGGCTELIATIETGDLFDKLRSLSIPFDKEGPKGENSIFDGESGIGGDPVLAPEQGAALNTVTFETAMASDEHTAMDAMALGRELQMRSLELIDKFAIGGGSRIDYASMRRSDALREYIQLASVLATVPMESLVTLPDAQKISFFANLYNAFIVHATCILGACEDSPDARSAFFSGTSGAKYCIAGELFSPDELEHGLLRSNRRHPYSTPPDQKTYFRTGDRRTPLAVSDGAFDPRIHFILNCGASSCPPIRVLGQTVEEVDNALMLASWAYLRDQMTVRDGVLCLPKLAFWYAADFGEDAPMQVKTLLGMLSTEDRQEVFQRLGIDGVDGVRMTVVEAPTSSVEGVQLMYNTYSWKSNAA